MYHLYYVLTALLKQTYIIKTPKPMITSHDYSAHQDHSKDNVPYILYKHIIAFVSNEEKTEHRLNKLKNWLKSCKYHENVIDRAFRNARLQGAVPLKTHSNIVRFVTTYYDNVNNNEKAKKIRRKFNDIQSDHLKYVFKNSNLVLAQKQLKNYSVCYLKIDLMLTPKILYNLRSYLNGHINAAKSVCCM